MMASGPNSKKGGSKHQEVSQLTQEDDESPKNQIARTLATMRANNMPEDVRSNLDVSGGDHGTKPDEVWWSRDSLFSGITCDKQTIVTVCSTYLFPRVKFLNKQRDMDYSDKRNSLCQHVIEHCNVSTGIDKAIWWQQNRKHVLATITSLCSNKATALKNAFFGKSLWIVPNINLCDV